MTKDVKIPVLHLHHNNDAELYYAKVKEDKTYLDNENVASFCGRSVINVTDRRGKHKKRFKTLLYLDGKTECVIIPDPETETDLIEPLTNKDRRTVVKREIAKQLGKFRPMETWQFLIIMILLGSLIAMQFIPGI